MKKLLTIGILSIMIISCKKQTIAPQQIVQTNNQSIICDTIDCIGAHSQGTYTFSPNNGSDTIILGCNIRLTYDGLHDSVQIGTSGVYDKYDWYKVSCINFDSRIQTLDQSKTRLSISKLGTYVAVSFYTKSNKRAIFRSAIH